MTLSTQDEGERVATLRAREPKVGVASILCRRASSLAITSPRRSSSWFQQESERKCENSANSCLTF
jgi:hypothetical protein